MNCLRVEVVPRLNMATIGEHAQLLGHVQGKDLISVTDNRVDGEIILTNQSSGISTFKVESQKPLQSWSISRMVKVTCPVVYNKKMESYITVVNHQTIRMWPKTEETFDKALKKHCKFKIREILNVDGQDPLIVCQNGGVIYLSDLDPSSIPEGQVLFDDQILLCEAAAVGKSVGVIYLIKRKESDIMLIISSYRSGRWEQQVIKLDNITVDNVGVCSASSFGSKLKMFVMGKTGDLQTIEVDVLSGHWDVRHVGTVPDVCDRTVMVALNQTCIAVAGCVHEGVDSLGIFNTKFGTMQVWKTLPEYKKSSLKIYVQHDHLVVLCDKTLYCYSYECTLSSVDSILGNLSVPSEIDKFKGTTVVWNKKEPNMKKTNDEINKVLNKLTQTASKKKEREFHTCAKQLIRLLQTEDANVITADQYLGEVLDLCISTEGFWPQNAVQDLLLKRLIPHKFVSKLFDTLISQKETGMIFQGVQILSDIPEYCICKCIEYALSSEDASFKESLQAKDVDNRLLEVDSSCPISGSKAYFLRILLNIPCNDIYVLDHLRKMPFKNVLVLLQYLNYLLVQSDEAKLETRTISMLKVVEWICRLVDAHVTQLIISTDSRQILLDLHDIVQSQLQLYDELVILDTLLVQLKERSAIPKTQSVGDYCIEVLHIL